MDVGFSLKSNLIIHLNHSNRIINEQGMAKIRTMVKTKQGVPHLFRTCTGTGSILEGCTGSGSRCTGTGHRKMTRMCVFLPFFHMLIPKSTQYSINTSKPLQIHLVISFLLKLSFNSPLMNSIELKHAFHSSLIQGLGFTQPIFKKSRVLIKPRTRTNMSLLYITLRTPKHM